MSSRVVLVIKRVSLSLALVLALVLVSAPVSAAPREPSSSHRTAAARQIALGVSMLPDGADSYTAFKAATGNATIPAPALWSLWVNWADDSSAFPTAMVATLKKAGTVPLIFWQPTGYASPPNQSGAPLQQDCGTPYTTIIGGAWDSYITTWATAAMNSKSRILVRFAHEMDGKWFPWGDTNCGNTPAGFMTMWKHVVSIFRTVGATNVKFVWSPYQARAKQVAFYPGNGWVDYIGFTVFNWAGAHPPAAWTDLVTGIKQATKNLTYAGGKPWIVAETGSAEAPGHTRASWLTTGYKGVYSQLPKVAAIVYFDMDMTAVAGQPDWSLGSADLSAYAALLKTKKFQGKIS